MQTFPLYPDHVPSGNVKTQTKHKQNKNTTPATRTKIDFTIALTHVDVVIGMVSFGKEQRNETKQKQRLHRLTVHTTSSSSAFGGRSTTTISEMSFSFLIIVICESGFLMLLRHFRFFPDVSPHYCERDRWIIHGAAGTNDWRRRSLGI